MSRETLYLKKEIDRLRRENNKLKELLVKSEDEMNHLVDRNQVENQQLQQLFGTVYPKIQAKLSSRRSEMSTSYTYKSDASSVHTEVGIQVDTNSLNFRNLHIEALEQNLETLEFSVREAMTQDSIDTTQVQHSQEKIQNLQGIHDKITDDLNSQSIRKCELHGEILSLQQRVTLLKRHIENTQSDPVPSFLMAL